MTFEIRKATVEYRRNDSELRVDAVEFPGANLEYQECQGKILSSTEKIQSARK